MGTVSSGSLTFNYTVTAAGVITNPPMAGIGSWSVMPTYNAGFGTGQPILTLPVGTNNTPAAVREIINLPPAASP